MDILKRFLNYISFDTTSDSSKEDNPSTKNQIEFAKFLLRELKDMGLEIHFDVKHCYIYALLRGNKDLPKVGFISHLDTSQDACGKNIIPVINSNYDGSEIFLRNGISLSTNVFPKLKEKQGKTLITSDGTTLLGADDKAGITEIMYMLEYFRNNDEEHGDVYVCFTPDEEIGLGTLNFDKKYFNPEYAYTVDGRDVGEFSYENFNAATATINIKGVSSHCGSAKGVMINAGRIATIINSLLPEEIPETTEGYEGFYHLDELSGNVSTATMKYLIRDFDKENFEKRKQILMGIVEKLNEKYDNCIEINIKDTYRNMKEIIDKYPFMVESTLKAISNVGITPEVVPIRGGTDGTNISFMGIPCPNLGTGGNNFHSVYEYICLEDMILAGEILISIVKEYKENKVLRREK